MRWISVKDRLPEYAKWVLLFHAKVGVVIGNRCLTDGNGEHYDIQVYGRYVGGVTHWIPMPKNPGGGK